MSVAYEFTPLLIPFALATGCVFLPWYLVEEFSDDRFQIALAVFSVSLAVWSLGEMLRVSATTIAAERVWHNVRFIGPAFGSVGYFVFTAIYTNHDRWVERQRLWLLFVIPAVTTVLAWTNPQHMLVRTAVEPSGTGPFVMAYSPGPWFVVHAAYSYVLTAVGTVWIVNQFLEFKSNTYFRKQGVSILLSVLVIMSANLAYNLGLTTVEWTPVGGALWAIVFTIALSQYRIFDLSPLARDVVVENVESGMVVTNVEGEIVDVNGVGATIIGIADDELIGRQLDDVFITSQETIEGILAAEESRETVAVQTEETNYYDITVSPISMPSDEAVGQVIMFTEVTDRVEQQQQLAAQKQSLERQNERLDEFASVVSHDLRNPLSTIDGWLRVADDAVTGDEPALDDAETAIENIEQAHERMETIVDGLLMLARAGQTVEETEAVELKAVASESWEHAAVDGCDLETPIPDGTTIDADRDRLRRVFENLYRNAADHNDKPVTLRTGILGDPDSSTGSGQRQGFYIEDDGNGIPAEQRTEVFEHGYTTSDDGTGIGLSIVKDIITAHGWDIEITAGSDGGARFEITGVDINR